MPVISHRVTDRQFEYISRRADELGVPKSKVVAEILRAGGTQHSDVQQQIAELRRQVGILMRAYDRSRGLGGDEPSADDRSADSPSPSAVHHPPAVADTWAR